MEAVVVHNGILLRSCLHFDLAQTLDCGQAFRWQQTEDGAWHGVACAKPLTLRQTAEGILLEGVSPEDYHKIWAPYFDMDRDYGELIQCFSSDPSLKSAADFCPGIRLLRQETWETVCCFIISQNNNIPRIKGIVQRLCENFGEAIGGGEYAFPTPAAIAKLSIDDLSVIRCGFRAKYLIDAASKVENGQVDLNALQTLPLEQAKENLLQIYGVGPKVAQCILLYGCGRMDAFPVDVWMRRVLDRLYPDGLPACTKGVQGIAQQYLFHYARCVPEALSVKEQTENKNISQM